VVASLRVLLEPAHDAAALRLEEREEHLATRKAKSEASAFAR
jgi:hypothetical protein